MANEANIKIVVLDIEGTTTPISFVAETLFPYIRRNLRSYVNDHWETEQLQKDIKALRDLSLEDSKNNASGVVVIPESEKDKVIDAVIQNVEWQMNQDRKSTALKQLQGHMWRSGYESGELKGFVYPDVFASFKKWKDLNVPVYIYSSGSIEAQKLLFGWTHDGDLLPYLKGHFDTTIGSKVESTSYEAIYNEICKGLDKSQVLFATDNILEAEAAAKFGIQAVIANRPGNKQLPENHKFNVVDSFDQLFELFKF